MKKTIWLLSAYRSDSHAVWADWLIETFKEFDWFKLELPGRHFRWRIRGNPLSWLHQLPEEMPDFILATSMVDIATIKGLHPRLANVPCLYYFHENQFAYPVSKHQVDSVEPKLVQLYGALASQSLVFNSAYNRDTFLSGVAALLKKFPDDMPDSIVDELKQKCSVLPVVIKQIENNVDVEKNKKLILWNHRWEYDKAPQVFYEALVKLNRINPDFELALLGSRSKNKPEVLVKIEDEFAGKIIVSEKLSKQGYERILLQSSIVVSTAIHEFEGLAILEAISAGATPLVPDDLCYREQYDELYRYPVGDSQVLAKTLSDFLDSRPESPNVSFWYGDNLVESWRNLLSNF